MPVPDVSLIIASYNTRDLTCACIQSIKDATHRVSYEIIVVDDCSPDDSRKVIRETFPDVTLIENEVNVRYAKTNNAGLQAAKGRYGVLLNSDTVIQPNAFDILVEFMDAHPEVAGCGPKLINPDGSVQHCIRSFAGPMTMLAQTLNLHLIWPKNPWTDAYYNTKFQYDKPERVQSIGTTAFVIRREIWEKYGMLDERFTLAFVDLAYCHMLWQNDLPIYIVPEAVVLHYGSQSINQNGIKEIEGQHKALRSFYDLYVGKDDNAVTKGLVRTGIAFRKRIKLLEFKLSRDKRVLKGPGAPGWKAS